MVMVMMILKITDGEHDNGNDNNKRRLMTTTYQ